MAGSGACWSGAGHARRRSTGRITQASKRATIHLMEKCVDVPSHPAQQTPVPVQAALASRNAAQVSDNAAPRLSFSLGPAGVAVATSVSVSVLPAFNADALDVFVVPVIEHHQKVSERAQVATLLALHLAMHLAMHLIAKHLLATPLAKRRRRVV